MIAIEFQQLTMVIVLLIVAAVAALTVMGTVDSVAILGGSILLAVAVVTFQLGIQYRELRDA